VIFYRIATEGIEIIRVLSRFDGFSTALQPRLLFFMEQRRASNFPLAEDTSILKIDYSFLS